MADDKKDKIVLFLNSDEPKRVYPPFFIASAAAAMEIEVVMYFCMGALNIIRKGGAEKIRLEGVPKPLEEYLQIVQEGGGKLMACSPGMPVVKLTKEEMIDGPEIVGGPSFVMDAQDADFVMAF